MSESTNDQLKIGGVFGVALAITISFVTYKSVLWAILHGICGWFYVVYYLITR